MYKMIILFKYIRAIIKIQITNLRILKHNTIIFYTNCKIWKIKLQMKIMRFRTRRLADMWIGLTIALILVTFTKMITG